MQIKIFIGADHRGFKLKQKLIKRLVDEGYQVEDLGNNHFDPNDDYPDFALKVALEVVKNPDHFGILLCGSGIGVAIAANKVEGIRAALTYDVTHAILARHDENANIATLPADNLDLESAWEIVRAFLTTKFFGTQKHIRRINKIEEIEDEYDELIQ